MTRRANAQIAAAPEAFAALADELQRLAGKCAQGTPGGSAANGQQQGNFTAADRERFQKLFGNLDGSLADGIETNIEEKIGRAHV